MKAYIRRKNMSRNDPDINFMWNGKCTVNGLCLTETEKNNWKHYVKTANDPMARLWRLPGRFKSLWCLAETRVFPKVMS